MERELEEWIDGAAPAKGARPPKMRYSHRDMIDFLIANPGISQNAIAARYGYSASWVSVVMSSDAFQSALAARREEIVDPALLTSTAERFKALTEKSLEILMLKLSKPQVSDAVALRAVELGAKAMGLGGNAPPPRAEVPVDHLERLAQRLVALQSSARPGITYEPVDAAFELVADQGSAAPQRIVQSESPL